VARGIAKFLLRMQTKFSEFMNANTKNIPVKRLKIFLIAFCLFGGGGRAERAGGPQPFITQN
jgi:hypothetical protein